MSPNESHFSLNQVAAEFAEWRVNRPYPRSTVPEALREKAVALQEFHPKRQVADALGIHPEMLRRWQSKRQGQDPSSSSFIPIDTSFEPANSAATVAFTVTLGHRSWQIQGPLSLSQITAVVQGLCLGKEAAE